MFGRDHVTGNGDGRLKNLSGVLVNIIVFRQGFLAAIWIFWQLTFISVYVYLFRWYWVHRRLLQWILEARRAKQW